MTEEEVHRLAKNGDYNGSPLKGKVQETHISYVILADKFAFKIKKPVKFSFLDFSSLAKRRKFCEREVELNSRFSPIYREVVPIRKGKSGFYIGSGKDDIVDYAVKMKKLMASRKMDAMLEKGNVTKAYIEALAEELASFHEKAEVIMAPFDKEGMKDLFNGILDAQVIVEDLLGGDDAAFVQEAVRWSNQFIDTHAKHMEERVRRRFVRDLHGDLHSGNIFLYRKPVLFDCIEFNDSFRQIDVLSEIAFLAMDLEASGERGLSRHFVICYTNIFSCMNSREDEELLLYYKCHRANVRAKIHALGAKQEERGESFQKHVKSLRLYLSLMRKYIKLLSVA